MRLSSRPKIYVFSEGASPQSAARVYISFQVPSTTFISVRVFSIYGFDVIVLLIVLHRGDPLLDFDNTSFAR